jgi:hypothetical protein
MTSRRNLAALVAVLVVLIGISVAQKVGHRRETSRAAATVLLKGEFQADGIGRLELGRGGGAALVVLSPGPDGWVVESAWGARASRERIDTLLSTLSNLSGEYRSDKRDVLPDYGLDAAGAVTIRGFGKDGQPVFALDVGTRPQGGQGNFVKLPDSDDVYLTPAGVLAQLGIYGEPQAPAYRYFLDLQAVQEDRVAVDAIRLRDASGTRELVKVFTPPTEATGDSAATAAALRATWEWKTGGGTRGPALAKPKVDAVLNSLVNIRATDLADPGAPASSYGLDTPAREAALVLADGRMVVLEFGADRPAAGDKPGGAWMRVRGQPTVWVVTEYTVSNVFKALSELKPD